MSHNGVSSFFPFGEPTPEIQAQIAANTRFDLFVSAIDPTTLGGLSITELLNFYGPGLRFLQGTDASDIRYLDQLLPQDLFCATAAGERLASIGLDVAAIDLLITNYYIAPVLGRSVPSPAGLAVLGFVGLAGARRQRG